LERFGCWTEEPAMPLTDKEIRAFKPSEKRVRKADGHGLFLEIAPTGAKVFRYTYRFDGKQRPIVVGDYPATSLADARIKQGEFKRMLRDGIDPKEEPVVPEFPEEPAGQSWNAVFRRQRRSPARALNLYT
jgi:hypothetical protein